MKRSSVKQTPPNHELVFAALRRTGKPQTAYELLDRVRTHGISAPPTVYRALERLIGDGRAHRLESLNAFVACAHSHHGGAVMFSICGSCGAVEEFVDTGMARRASTWARKAGFQLSKAVIEVHGLCGICASGHIVS